MSVAFFQNYLTSLQGALATIDLAAVDHAATLIRQAQAAGRTVYVFGNGGSFATASHFVCDVVKGASYGRAEKYKMLCLMDNFPTMTAYSNDVSYDEAVLEQLKNFAVPGDVTIAISGSGNSPNVVKATEWAKENGLSTITMTGRDGGKLKDHAHCNIHVKDQHMGRIEDGHMVACHMLAYLLMEPTPSRS